MSKKDKKKNKRKKKNLENVKSLVAEYSDEKSDHENEIALNNEIAELKTKLELENQIIKAKQEELKNEDLEDKNLEKTKIEIEPQEEKIINIEVEKNNLLPLLPNQVILQVNPEDVQVQPIPPLLNTIKLHCYKLFDNTKKYVCKVATKVKTYVVDKSSYVGNETLNFALDCSLKLLTPLINKIPESIFNYPMFDTLNKIGSDYVVKPLIVENKIQYSIEEAPQQKQYGNYYADIEMEQVGQPEEEKGKIHEEETISELIRPNINQENIDEDFVVYRYKNYGQNFNPAFIYFKKLMKYKRPHTGFEYSNHMMQMVLDMLYHQVEANNNYEYDQIKIHKTSFNLAYTTLYPTLLGLYSQFRMRLNYRYSPAERSYWFCKFANKFVTSHLIAKDKYQINVNNINAMGYLILTTFLNTEHHIKCLIDPMITVDQEEFEYLNARLANVLKSPQVLELQVPFYKLTLIKCLLYYYVTKFHFQLPENVSSNGGSLDSVLTLL